MNPVHDCGFCIRVRWNAAGRMRASICRQPTERVLGVLLAVWRGFESLQEVNQLNEYSIVVCLAHSNAECLSPQLYGILATIVYLCKDHTRKVDFPVEILPDNVFGCWEWNDEKGDFIDPVHGRLNLSLSQRLAYDVFEERFVV